MQKQQDLSRNEETTPKLTATAKQPLPVDYERIRERIMELAQLTIEGMEQDSTSKSMGLTAMAPVVTMMLQNYDPKKLHLLVTCLSGIGMAVLDSACSEDEYNERVVPLIKGLQEALA